MLAATSLKERCIVQEEMVVKEFHEKALLKVSLKEILQKESDRIAGQRHVSSQSTIETSCAEVQTEFVQTDRSLRTTMIELGERQPQLAPATLSLRKQFPIAIAAPVSLLSQASSRPVFGQMGSAAKPSPQLPPALAVSDVIKITELTKELSRARLVEAGVVNSKRTLKSIDDRAKPDVTNVTINSTSAMTTETKKGLMQTGRRAHTVSESADNQPNTLRQSVDGIDFGNTPFPQSPPPPQNFIMGADIGENKLAISPVVRGYQNLYGDLVRRNAEAGRGPGGVREMILPSLAQSLSPLDRPRLSSSAGNGSEVKPAVYTPVLQPRKEVRARSRKAGVGDWYDMDANKEHPGGYQDQPASAASALSALSLGSYAPESPEDQDGHSINDDMSIGSNNLV